MHLKRLEIHGFKSFFERTEIEFRPGITAVVGPNGSGKSNVSDALLWVLGEQNARQLRGEGSADLIFAGTDKRRALGMAEVSLCIDNADRGLPLDYGEVTITRRVYRSGEGEYFINRTACRLKDIYELFLDTGVGRDAYSIIGQNQIHAVLSARGEERRELLEEAAGIKKYRHRRKESQRKLESTRQNLTRVSDILDELEGQVEPLEIQAKVAERWQGLNAQLRELEIGLLAIDLLRKTEEMERIQTEREGLEQQVQSLSARLTREEAAEYEARLELTRMEGSIESVRRSRDLAREEALKLEGELNLTRQQAVADASERMRLVAEQTRWEARAEELAKEAEALERERLELDARLADLTRQSSEHAPAIEAAQRRMREVTAALERLRRQHADANARKAGLEEKARQIEAQLREGADRMGLDRRRLEELTAEVEAATLRHTESEETAAHSRSRLDDLQTELKSLEADIAASRQAHQNAQAALRERQTQGMRLAARLRSLEEMHRSLEGVYRGVKAVIQAARSGALSGDFRVVADLLTVPPEYATAMEVALGGHAQDVVCPRDREAQEAIRYLKSKNAGRATFLPLDLVRGERMRPDLAPGILGVASDLVEYTSDVRPAVEMLLGRILIVETMETAVNLLRMKDEGRRMKGPSASGRTVHPSSFSLHPSFNARMVTLEGESVNPNGSLTGGSREGGPGILSRKVEIDRLTAEVEAETKRLQEEEIAVQTAANALTRLDARRESLRGEIASARVEVAQRESAAENAGREMRRLARERTDAENRLATGQTRLDEAETRRKERQAAFVTVCAELERLESEETDAGDNLSAASEAWETARTSASDVQLELARVREQRRSLEDRLRRHERTRKEVLQGEGSARESLLMLEERRGQSTGKEDALASVLDARRDAAAKLDAQLNDLAGKRTAWMGELGEKAAALKALAGERETALERSHKLEVREAGLVSDIEHLQLRLLVDYEAEPDHAPMLAQAVASRQNTAIEVNRLKREMAALGTVNIGAIEEYKRVFERVEFLSTQRADLEEAEATLLRVISEIDATTQEAFQATFERVAASFDEMFKKLFNGGRTQLVLTEPANVLETGIDIIVQPPGKKLQHLQLLSGGEKAMTAVALLFALLEVKPSPFCLLDEVDAALDEANVGRFADVVKDFAERSQFIIITHNKSTMAAADTLCGVTMEEPGVSKILSVKLED